MAKMSERTRNLLYLTASSIGSKLQLVRQGHRSELNERPSIDNDRAAVHADRLIHYVVKG